jgi:hypothetical protein
VDYECHRYTCMSLRADVFLFCCHTRLQRNLILSHTAYLSRGRNHNERVFVEKIDSYNWAGPVLWHDGRLSIIRESKLFPSGKAISSLHGKVLIRLIQAC